MLCEDEPDRLFENDLHLFGRRVADGLNDENGQPDYRRWECEMAITDRLTYGMRV